MAAMSQMVSRLPYFRKPAMETFMEPAEHANVLKRIHGKVQDGALQISAGLTTLFWMAEGAGERTWELGGTGAALALATGARNLRQARGEVTQVGRIESEAAAKELVAREGIQALIDRRPPLPSQTRSQQVKASLAALAGATTFAAFELHAPGTGLHVLTGINDVLPAAAPEVVRAVAENSPLIGKGLVELGAGIVAVDGLNARALAKAERHGFKAWTTVLQDTVKNGSPEDAELARAALKDAGQKVPKTP